MRLGLINSAWSQAGKDAAFGVWKTKELGFDSIDILTDPLDAGPMELRLIKNECERAELPIVSVACVALGLADFNNTVRRFHAERVRAHLDTARMLGARNLLLVIGEYVWQNEVIPAAEQWTTAVRQLQALGDYAGDLGLEIALEMEPFEMSLLRTVDDMIRFLDEVDRPSVRANVDISHMALARQPAEELLKLKGRAAHVHISDCDGRVHGDLPPGRGVVDFPPYLRAIQALGLPDDAAVSIELEFAPEPDRIVDWVREARDSTARLLREAGLRA